MIGNRGIHLSSVKKPDNPTRRTLLRITAPGAAALLAHAIPAPRLAAQSPTKVVVGRVPVNALASNYIGEVDFFRDEGLALEPTRFDNAGQMFQAMTAGDLVAGEIGLAPSIIGLTRGLPLIAPFLGACST